MTTLSYQVVKFCHVIGSTAVWGGGRVWPRCHVSYITRGGVGGGGPTDIGLQLGIRPAILVANKGRRECFFFLFCFFLFLSFHSCSTFFPVPLSSPLLSLLFLLRFSGRRHKIKMSHKGWRVVKPHHNQKQLYEEKPDFHGISIPLVYCFPCHNLIMNFFSKFFRINDFMMA